MYSHLVHLSQLFSFSTFLFLNAYDKRIIGGPNLTAISPKLTSSKCPPEASVKNKAIKRNNTQTKGTDKAKVNGLVFLILLFDRTYRGFAAGLRSERSAVAVCSGALARQDKLGAKPRYVLSSRSDERTF